MLIDKFARPFSIGFHRLKKNALYGVSLILEWEPALYGHMHGWIEWKEEEEEREINTLLWLASLHWRQLLDVCI